MASRVANPAQTNVTSSTTDTSILGPTLVWVSLRLALGWVFLWGFLDKVFGFGFNTASENAWINGGSPTFGFLKFGTSGPFASIFQSMAGSPIVDVLFMAGQLGIGLALILGIGIRIASISGIIMMGSIYLSMFMPEFNPFIDEHIMYMIIFVGFLFIDEPHQVMSLRSWWLNLPIVQQFKFLQ